MGRQPGHIACSLIVAVAISAAAGVASSNEQLKQRLIGTWVIVEASIDNKGVREQPFGSKPLGMLMFDNQGRFIMFFSRPDIPGFVGSRTAGSDKENREVVRGSLAYFGTYEVLGTADINMHITGSTFPNLNGADQRRKVRIDDKGELVIFNESPSTGAGLAASIWRRAPPQ